MISVYFSYPTNLPYSLINLINLLIILNYLNTESYNLPQKMFSSLPVTMLLLLSSLTVLAKISDVQKKCQMKVAWRHPFFLLISKANYSSVISYICH